MSRLQYPTNIRLIRVMCSGRVDLDFIFRAFETGQDGVLIGGCKLNECNYITHGNFDALGNTHIAKDVLKRIGLNPERLAIEFMSGGDGNRLAEVVNRFTEKVRELGPLGAAEGLRKEDLQDSLAAVRGVIPCLRLTEREKIRPPERSEEGYRRFFAGDEMRRILDERIGDTLTIGRIAFLLRRGALSSREISARLGLKPADVSRHISAASKQGWVRYDTDSNSYSLPPAAARS